MGSWPFAAPPLHVVSPKLPTKVRKGDWLSIAAAAGCWLSPPGSYLCLLCVLSRSHTHRRSSCFPSLQLFSVFLLSSLLPALALVYVLMFHLLLQDVLA